MDQAAFRSLIASSSSTPRPATSSHSKFGAPPPKRGAEPKEEFKKPSFKPRVTADKAKGKKFKKKEDDADDGGAYRDRAAERRMGKSGDFAGAEKLLEDFKARSEGVEDKKLVEEQMKYLGGDAEHSVLVKGLDMALLERMKTQHSLKDEMSIEEVEDELDAALLAKPKKKSRDEILSELKASRDVPLEPATDVDALEKAKMAGRFKPINSSAPDKKGKKKDTGVVPGEKKRRKKIKPAAPMASTIPATSNTSATPSPSDDPSSSHLAPTPTVPAVIVPTFDDDDDIFGDVGEYKGLDTDSEDDAPASLPAVPAPSSSSATTTKRKYFDDDDDDADVETSTAPEAVTKLAREVAARPRPDAREEGEEDDGAVPMKLQPLSGSSSVRDLLDMDKAAEKEEKRKAKKLKNAASGGPGGEKKEKVRTDEDKANRDYQVMMNHLEKKDKKARDS